MKYRALEDWGGGGTWKLSAVGLPCRAENWNSEDFSDRSADTKLIAGSSK
jgi:hypothetical protein